MKNKFFTGFLVLLTVAVVTILMNPFAVNDLKAADPSASFQTARQSGKPVFLMFSSDT
ncbi:MAG TPA: hypothetical protein VK905_05750 [Bacillota bacterium]|nr:hypothetical protein [Bacillota bacterium]